MTMRTTHGLGKDVRMGFNLTERFEFL